ncbi:hypothetical protein PLESTB_000561900 [Pleodorina starrii]|uniref:Uncharacterized protein n=1 Tax=Pleodorina starrii TaxID=330485 RepID=A0A9W6BHK2_9CHLO|nr:hypothetical protein PLESTB_000561900 [Pleodorina starrii]
MEPGGGAPPLRGPPRGRPSDTDGGMLVPRGPVSEDVLAAISERATAIFSSHKHKVSGMLEPQQGPYALALVGAMLGLNQKQLDSELQLTARVGRRQLSYEEFMSACEAMVALHGALAQQQVKRLPNNDMSAALRAAFSLYVKLNVGGFMGSDQRMNSNQFTKMCQDAGMMEPNGPASMSTLQISWASCKATFGSSRLQYSQFIKVIGALAAELSGDVFLLVAGLGLQLPTVPPLRNGFRKPDAGEVNLQLPKPEVVQGVGAHVAAEEAYEKYMQEGKAPDGGRRGDPLARGGASPIKARPSVNGGVPNWVKAMQADQGGVGPMTSGQDIRGIPVIETPDSDDESPRRPQARKPQAPVPPDDGPPMARGKASPMRPRMGKLPAMGAADPMSASLDSELLIRADQPNYGGPGNRVDVLSAPVSVRPRDAVRNGIHPDDGPGALEPSLLPAPPRVRKGGGMAPEGFREVVEQQAAAVKALEGRVEEQKQREQELFERVQLLTEKLADAQAVAAVTVQSGCPGAPLPDVPQGKGRTVVSGRCPLTDQVQRLTEQMGEVLARLSALESIRMQPKAPTEPAPKTRNPVGTRTPEFPEEPVPVAPVAVASSWGPPGGGRGRGGGVPEPDGVRVISPLEPVNATQGEWMSRLLLNLDKRMRVLEGAAGKGDADADGEALAEVLKQLRGMQTAGSPAPPAPPVPSAAAAPPDPAFLKVDPKRKMEKVADTVDLAPALLPTGDPELDRRLAALANEMRSKHATVGLLLDMLNQTRGEVAALAAQLNGRGPGDGAGGPVVVGQRVSVAGSPGQRNAIRVVDGGLVVPDVGPGLSPPMRRGEPAPEGMVPLEPHLENLAAEQHGLKRAVRELCAAIGVAPPPAIAAAVAEPPPPAPAAVLAVVAPRASEPEPWGQPGRPKTLKEETQEVKRSVEGVQADVGELRRQVEAMRAVAGYGEWPQPLRHEGGGVAAATVAVAPVQAVAQGQGRNPVQVMVGAPSLPGDPAGLAPGRRPMQSGGELSIAGLPDAEVHSLKDELRRVKAFVGMPAEAAPVGGVAAAATAVVAVAPVSPAAAAAAAAEEGKWADAGRGPQPLKDAVTTVAADMEALRKHVKAMDAALRTNIGNTNNLTSFINEHAPALSQAVQPAKDGHAAGGRNPITVTAGELQQQQGGLQPPGRKGPLPLQNEGAFEAGGLDPVEYQRLKDQVRSMARFLGGPVEPGAGSPAPAAPPQPGAAAVAGGVAAEGMLPPWGAPGRGGGGRGGATVAEGLGQVSSDVETLKKQVAQMGFAMRAAGVVDPSVEAATAAAVAAGGAEAVAVRQRNPISVMPGGASADGSTGFAPPGRKSQPGQEGAMPSALEADVGRLKDDVRAMKHFLGTSLPVEGAAAAGAGAAARGVGEGGQAGGAGGGSEPWGRAGQFPRDVNDVDPIRRAGGYGNVGEMARDLDAVKRRQGELEEAMRAANLPLPAAAEQSGPAVRVVGGGAAQRNPISVSPGLVERPDAVGLKAPKRPLQPLNTIEGVPEPVLNHLGAMQDDLRRVTAFLGMRAACSDPSAPHAEPPAAAAAATAAAPPGPQQPWGTPPGAREAARGDDKEGPPVGRLSDLVRDVQETKQRQEGTERVLAAMGAQVPWAMEGAAPAAPGAQPVAVGQAAQQEPGQQRQRNPIHVTAGGLQEGATGFAPPGRKQFGLPEGMPEALPPVIAQLADEVRRVQAFLGMNPAAIGPAAAAAAAGPEAARQVAVAPGEGRSAGVEPWGSPGREPRQPGQEVKNLGEVVRDVDTNNRRMAQLEEALRAAGIPIPPTLPAGVSTVAVSGAPPEQAGRQRNPINVTAGGLQEGATGFAAPGRKLLPALEGLPEPAQVELARMADDMRRLQAFLGMNPAGVVPAAAVAAGPEAARQVAVAPGESRSAGVEPWGSPGREPRQPGQEVKNLGEVVRETDNNNRRIAVLEEALRAAGIPIPPTLPSGVSTVAVSGAPPDQAGRQRNPINVTAGGLQEGATGFAAPGRRPLALEGLPEPTQVELQRLTDDVRRMQAFMGMNPAGVVPAAAVAAGPEAARQVAVAPGEGRSAGVEPWGSPGREPRQPGQDVKNLGEVVRDVDTNNRRMAQLEEALRAAGIPIPPPQPAAAMAVSGASTEQAGRQRNPINVTAGGLQEGATGFAAPGRKLMALEGLPEPTQVELQRLADDMRRMQAFLGMNPAGVVPAAAVAAGPEAARQVAVAPGEGRSAGVEPWGSPGREPRQPGQEVKNLGEVVRDVDANNRRMAQLEEALRAAGIPIPPPQPAPAMGVSGALPEQAGRQRNPINVTAGGLQEGNTGFAAPGRKLMTLEGLPEPTQVELQRMADDLKRVQAFLGMNPTGVAPVVASPEAARQVAVAPGESRSAGVEPWGSPGREPRQPGQEVKNLGEVVRDVETNNRRMAQLEEALRAAGIPIPPPQPAAAMGVSGAPPEQAGRQRNPINVTAGGLQEGTTGFAAPGRKLMALEGLPEPTQVELARMADDMRRIQAFLGMNPAGVVPAAAAGPEAARQVAVSPGEGRSAGVEPWGSPGREPRQPGQEVKNLGEVVRDVDTNNRRMAQLEEALRAAGIPIPPPQPAAAMGVSGAPPEQAGRQRNPINVTAGSLQEGSTGFAAPGRKPMALEGLPEPTQVELQRMADDLKRVQAFLGMNPTGVAPVAAAGPEAARQVAVAPGEGRSAGVEPWGSPGREPRQPGQEVKNLGDIVKDVDEAKQRVRQLEEALRSAGVPLPPPGAAAAVEPQQPQQPPGGPRGRNPIAVSSGLVPTEGATGFAAPKRAPGAEAPPELLPARLEALSDDVKRVKAFLGMQDSAAGPAASAAGPDGAGGAGAAAATDKGPWAGPGRDKAGGGGEGVAKELEDVKQQLNDLDRALRGAGMGYMLPKEAPGGPTAVQRQPEPADKQRGGVAVTAGGLQRPADAAGFPPLTRKDGLPPIQNPSFVDANDYGQLKDDVDRLKAFLGMETAKDPKAPAAAAVPVAAGVAAAAGNEPWANKSLREQADEAEKAIKDMGGEMDRLRNKVADMEEALRSLGGPDRPQQTGAASADVKGGGPGTPAGRNRNPIAVSPGLAETDAAKGFAPPDRKQTVPVPEGIVDPVVVDGEDYRQLKKAMEELQSVVGQQGPPPADGKKGKTLKEDTDDIKKFVRAMGKDVGAMGNDMQALKKHLDDVEGAMNRALANLAAEMAKMKLTKEEEPDSPEPQQGRRKLEAAGDNMADTINAMAALNAAQQQQLARIGDDNRAEDIDALNEAMRQSENQLARLLAFLKQDVMDRFAVHEKTLIRMAKQIDFIQRMLKGDFDDQREAARDAGSSLTVSAADGSVVTASADGVVTAGAAAEAAAPAAEW